MGQPAVGHVSNELSHESGEIVSEASNTMNLKEADQNYRDYSGLASTVTRQLSFAGIAFVWLLALGGKVPTSKVHIANDLLVIGFVLVITLASDFLQYVAGAALWGGFRRHQEKKGVLVFEAPGWINRPALTFFWLKIVGVLLAYVLLGIALSGRIS
jgi:hypothetical protein